MDEAEVEVDVDVDVDLEALGRKELQALAKSFGIRANQTSEQIRVAILQRKDTIVSRLEKVSSDDNDEPITGTNVKKNVSQNVDHSKSDGEEGGGIDKRATPTLLVPIPIIGGENDSTTSVIERASVVVTIVAEEDEVVVDASDNKDEGGLQLYAPDNNEDVVLVDASDNKDEGGIQLYAPEKDEDDVLVSASVNNDEDDASVTSENNNNNNEEDALVTSKNNNNEDDATVTSGNNNNNEEDNEGGITDGGVRLWAHANDEDVALVTSENDEDNASNKEQEHKLILEDQNQSSCDGDDDNDNNNDNDNNKNAHNHDDKYEESIEKNDVNFTATPNKEPFKVSNDRIVEQPTLSKMLITKRDDTTESNSYENYNSDININKDDHHGNNNDNKHVCSSSDGKASDKNQNKENSDYATDENENNGINKSVKGCKSNNNLALNEKSLRAEDNHIAGKLTSSKISFNSKRGDTVEKSEISNRISNHEKFPTKLPKYVAKKSIERQKCEFPLWRGYSKEFCRNKGMVRRNKRSQQIQTKLPGKGMRRPLHNSSKNTCKFQELVTTTRHYKAGTKKVVSMAMSKRNEEHMQKFLHRQSAGRQDRIKRLDDKIYAGLA